MNVILSSIKRGIRDKDVILSNIFLVLILPYVFTLIFSFEDQNEKLNINIIGNKNDKVIETYIDTLKEFDKNDKNVSLTYEIHNNKKEIENEKDSLTVVVNEKNNEISFIGSNKITKVERSVQGITEEFFNSMSLYDFISKEGSFSNTNTSIIKNTEYKVKQQSKDIFSGDFNFGPYFAVVMMQMAILTGSIIAFKNIFYLKESIGDRVKSSPKKILNLLSLELVGTFSLIFIEGVIMLGGITLIYGVDLNLKNLIPVLILIGTLSILSVCLGIFIIALCKKRTSGENVCSMIVTALVLASGQLMPQFAEEVKQAPLLELNPFVGICSEMSSLLTTNSSENMIGAIGISIIVSIVLIIASTIIIKRRVVK